MKTSLILEYVRADWSFMASHFPPLLGHQKWAMTSKTDKGQGVFHHRMIDHTRSARVELLLYKKPQPPCLVLNVQTRNHLLHKCSCLTVILTVSFYSRTLWKVAFGFLGGDNPSDKNLVCKSR